MSRDLSGALLALTSLHHYGVKWSRLPTRPRNALALTLAEQTCAVTSRLSVILREKPSSPSATQDYKQATTLFTARETAITELVSQYLSLLFCLHQIGAAMHVVPWQLRSALGEGLFCLRKLETEWILSGSGMGAEMEAARGASREWRTKAEELLRQMTTSPE